MMALMAFLAQTVLISMSGVMFPGPVTSATLAAGARRRHAGVLMAVGHGVIEFPLMVLIIAGMGGLFQLNAVKIGIGLVGGAFMAVLGVQILTNLNAQADPARARTDRSAVWTGIVLTATNPYFLIWWATVGLSLAGRASQFGVFAFGIFAVTHWICDLVWLEVLSNGAFHGSRVLAGKTQRYVLAVCGAALLFFAGLFIHDALRIWQG